MLKSSLVLVDGLELLKGAASLFVKSVNRTHDL